MSTPEKLELPTRRLDDGLRKLLSELKEGERIRITQTVRVGRMKPWEAVAVGVYRGVNYLATGTATHRVKEDDIVVPLIHFTKDNGELSSVAIDEKTRVERVTSELPEVSTLK